MLIAGGSTTEYNAMMAADVDVFLLKFEQFIKAQHGKGTH